MAQLHPTAPQVVDPVEKDINDTIDHLIRLLNVRRAELLNQSMRTQSMRARRRDIAREDHQPTDRGRETTPS